MSKYYIVMADVVRSTSYDGNELMPEFKRIVAECNDAFMHTLLSPFTITLGDEFQGIATSLRAAVDSLLFLEDRLLLTQPVFSLRYVLLYGAIDTPINPAIAHGMVGSGLASAREMLTTKRRGRPRFQVDVGAMPYSQELQMVFRLLELLSTHWQQKDYRFIHALLSKCFRPVARTSAKSPKTHRNAPASALARQAQARIQICSAASIIDKLNENDYHYRE